MPNEPQFDNDAAIDMQRLLAVLQRWVWLLAVGLILGAAAAYIYSRSQAPVYEAATNILVTRSSQETVADLTQSLNLTQLVETYVRMLSLDEFLAEVSQRTGYEVDPKQVSVTAPQNTQIIEVRVQDTDPRRATRIADAMVAVLVERNERLQASRYSDAQSSLELQIKDAEARIAEVQGQLDEAKRNALVDQVAEAKNNIDATVAVINTTQSELDRLDEMSWEGARFLLSSAKSRLTQLQSSLDQQLAERLTLQSKLETDLKAAADANYAAGLRKQIEDMDRRVSDTRQAVADTQQEIEFLTPLDSAENFTRVVVEKENFLQTQQSLLASYQDVYTNLLSTEEVKRTTNEIDALEKNLGLYQEIYLGLVSSLEDVKTQKLQNTPTVDQVSPATAGDVPVRPRTLLNTLLGALAGLLLAGGLVVLRESTDATVKTKEEVEKLLKTQVVGYIVEIKQESEEAGIYVARMPRSPVAEAFRSLRTNLEYSSQEQPLKSILVTSSGPSEGKTTVASNLAAILAHAGKTVLLVDADMRRPRVHRYSGVLNRVGLSEFLRAGPDADASDYFRPTKKTPGLSILPSGSIPEDPGELLSSEAMRQALHNLEQVFDFVILDAPPMVVSDPHVLSGIVDGVLLVMVPGKTRKDVIRAIGEQMRKSNARLLGVVFNRLRQRMRSSYGGYTYYAYPYYYSSDYYYVTDPAQPELRKRKKRRAKKPAAGD